MRSILQFTDYHVTDIEYKFDPWGEPDGEYLLPTFSFGLDFADEEKNKALITLGIEMGDPELEKNFSS